MQGLSQTWKKKNKKFSSSPPGHFSELGKYPACWKWMCFSFDSPLYLLCLSAHGKLTSNYSHVTWEVPDTEQHKIAEECMISGWTLNFFFFWVYSFYSRISGWNAVVWAEGAWFTKERAGGKKAMFLIATYSRKRLVEVIANKGGSSSYQMWEFAFFEHK